MKLKPIFCVMPACLLLTQCVMLDPLALAGYGGYYPGGSAWIPDVSGYQNHGWAGSGGDAAAPETPRHQSSGSRSRSSGSRPNRLPYPMDGTVTESYSGNRTWRDKHNGSITGSEWTSPAGTTTYRDSSGSILGSSDESPAGTRTYRDDRGSITQTSSTTQGTGGDSTTTFRRNGSVVGNKYVSPAGNVTWRDGSGSIIDGPAGMKP